jgi:hypothetical protein
MAEELRLLGEYTTDKAHDSYPAGSKCVAYRNRDNRVVLKMHDGGMVELDGNVWFCRGLEAGGDWLRGGPMAEIIAEEDKRCLEDIDRAIAACRGNDD